MFRVILIILIGAISYFGLESFISRIVVGVLSIGFVLFLDLYLIKKINYYKILTTLITSSLLCVPIGLIAYIFNLPNEITFQVHSMNVSSFVITTILITIFISFFFSLRLGANSLYFKRKLKDN